MAWTSERQLQEILEKLATHVFKLLILLKFSDYKTSVTIQGLQFQLVLSAHGIHGTRSEHVLQIV